MSFNSPNTDLPTILEREIREDKRCGGKLLETLGKLPGIGETVDEVTEIRLSIRSGKIEAKAALQKTACTWYVDDMDVDLKK